ncbi:type II toxin-antitoxin system RelE/ParE family toxin [Methylotuvimicrobium sp. KM1]|uniref:type II toxin-antitoxin system RelE/ParE family toxin n=1 Tax=Methylotuvimicrobium sp. KM1 TaxID=3377707 RepID=UPI00384E6F31
MKTYQVIFSPEAEEQLASLYRYLAFEASPNIAERLLTMAHSTIYEESAKSGQTRLAALWR